MLSQPGRRRLAGVGGVVRPVGLLVDVSLVDVCHTFINGNELGNGRRLRRASALFDVGLDIAGITLEQTQRDDLLLGREGTARTVGDRRDARAKLGHVIRGGRVAGHRIKELGDP